MTAERMKKIMAVLLAALVMGVFASTCLAEKGKSEPNAPRKEKKMDRGGDRAGMRAGMHEQRMDRLAELTKKLTLTEEQQKSIKPILEKQDKEMKAIHDNNSLAPAQRREKMVKLMQTTNQEINKILTPEQQKKFAEMGPGGRDSIKMRMESLTKRLDLTQEQQKSITPILENEGKEMKAIHDGNSLTPEQMREKMKAIHQTSHDAIMKVLTPEQQKKFEEMSLRRHDDRDANRPMRPRGEGRGARKGGPNPEN
jgi:Spy/CpxP family protein refolding chaperone